MPVFRLTDDVAFPSPDLAEDSGLLAVGGDLRPQRLLVAYALGIFPWYQEGSPILWHAPDPRMVLLPRELHVSRSLAKVMRRGEYKITLDTAFAEVIARCAEVPRDDQDGTWITREMQDAYTDLHELGYAHSAEAWHDGELVGGLYGVSLGRAFFGESMFATRSNASKVAFVTLVRWLERWPVDFVDCQVHTEHLEQFGATEWSRRRFSTALDGALDHPSRVGKWELD